VEHFAQWAAALLVPPRSDPIEERVANRLRKRLEHLFTFLTEEGVPADNNQSERDLRPAVIARKVPCGNKTVSGKATWEILASLADTCHKQKRSFVGFVAEAMPLAAPVIV
jgi:transposase